MSKLLKAILVLSVAIFSMNLQANDVPYSVKIFQQRLMVGKVLSSEVFALMTAIYEKYGERFLSKQLVSSYYANEGSAVAYLERSDYGFEQGTEKVLDAIKGKELNYLSIHLIIFFIAIANDDVALLKFLWASMQKVSSVFHFNILLDEKESLLSWALQQVRVDSVEKSKISVLCGRVAQFLFEHKARLQECGWENDDRIKDHFRKVLLFSPAMADYIYEVAKAKNLWKAYKLANVARDLAQKYQPNDNPRNDNQQQENPGLWKSFCGWMQQFKDLASSNPTDYD